MSRSLKVTSAPKIPPSTIQTSVIDSALIGFGVGVGTGLGSSGGKGEGLLSVFDVCWILLVLGI